MCPHGYHHSGSMATPALGTQDVYIYIYRIYIYIGYIYIYTRLCFLKNNNNRFTITIHAKLTSVFCILMLCPGSSPLSRILCWSF